MNAGRVLRSEAERRVSTNESLESSMPRDTSPRSVNSAMVHAYWNIGREIGKVPHRGTNRSRPSYPEPTIASSFTSEQRDATS
jgi:hypothetical protein